MNPVLLAELRGMLREPRGFLVPMAYALLLASAASIFLVPVLISPDTGGTEWFGGFLVGMVAVIQGVAVVIFAPLTGSAAFAAERERGTWLSLLGSPVPRGQIATGKTLAAVAYVALLLCVSAPLGGLALLSGGIDLPGLLGLYLVHLVVGASLASMGVALSTLFARTWTAALTAVALSGALCLFTGALYAAGFAILQAMSRESASSELAALMVFNPLYGLFLFFGGDADSASLGWWWAHLGAMASLGLGSLAFTWMQVQRLRG